MQKTVKSVTFPELTQAIIVLKIQRGSEVMKKNETIEV